MSLQGKGLFRTVDVNFLCDCCFLSVVVKFLSVVGRTIVLTNGFPGDELVEDNLDDRDFGDFN